MVLEQRLDEVLDSKTKVRIIRLFVSRRDDYMASGREIARLVDVTPPAAHAALKDLHSYGILHREIIGKQHIYRINTNSRIVSKMLCPAFQNELSLKKDVGVFLIEKAREYKIFNLIVSMFLYGSMAKGQTGAASDCDVAIIVSSIESKKRVEDIFIEKIGDDFSRYFGFHLDAYIKTAGEFLKLMRGDKPPVSTLMASYILLYGKDLKELKK